MIFEIAAIILAIVGTYILIKAKIEREEQEREEDQQGVFADDLPLDKLDTVIRAKP